MGGFERGESLSIARTDNGRRDPEHCRSSRHTSTASEAAAARLRDGYSIHTIEMKTFGSISPLRRFDLDWRPQGSKLLHLSERVPVLPSLCVKMGKPTMRRRFAAKAAKSNNPETYTAPAKPSTSIPNPRTKDERRQARHETFLKSLPLPSPLHVD